MYYLHSLYKLRGIRVYPTLDLTNVVVPVFFQKINAHFILPQLSRFIIHKLDRFTHCLIKGIVKGPICKASFHYIWNYVFMGRLCSWNRKQHFLLFIKPLRRVKNNRNVMFAKTSTLSRILYTNTPSTLSGGAAHLLIVSSAFSSTSP